MRRQWLTHREVWRELDLEGVEAWRAEQDALKEEQAAQQSPSEGTQAEGHDAEVPLGATATARGGIHLWRAVQAVESPPDAKPYWESSQGIEGTSAASDSAEIEDAPTDVAPQCAVVFRYAKPVIGDVPAAEVDLPLSCEAA